MTGVSGAEDMRTDMHADLLHIERTWGPTTDVHTLRREGVVLRRLLVDNGGDVTRLWRLDQRPGQPHIDGVIDLRSILGTGRVSLAVAEMSTATDSGMGLTSLAHIWTDRGLKVRTGLEEVGVRLTVRGYLRSACLVWQDTPVQRDDLITYVVNKRGGSHSDSSRSGSPARRAAHLALDDLRSQEAQVEGREPAYASFIALGRRLASSPDVRLLCSLP